MKKTLVLIGTLLVASLAWANDGKSCNMAEKKAAAHSEKNCNMAQHAAEKTVEMQGKLLCKHCNLHQSETCEKVFQPSSDEKTLYAVCPHSKVDLEKVGEEGAATLRVKGKLVKCNETGQQAFLIEEATKITEAGK